MAREVVWADSALASLLEAAEYIASDSPAYAAALVAGATNAGEDLNALSGRGRIVPEYRDSNIREVFVGSYRLIYQISPDAIEVIVFIHGARDLESLLRE